MAGIKGRSGRRPLRDEEKRMKIIDKAWELVGIKLESEDTDKYQVAKDIVVKDITQHLKGEGFSNNHIQYILIRNPKDQKIENINDENKAEMLTM